MKLLKQHFEKKMQWVPIVFGSFKLLVLVVAMYFGIKSHYDGEKIEKAKEKEREKESSKIQ
ncbi:hypothetical protein [Bordetella muralis]|jgi:hypothetical protein|uniref:hypothetical protein n=1 Tax=Bordetella muralis TaxID=1649130 RepID=UPI0039F0009B